LAEGKKKIGTSINYGPQRDLREVYEKLVDIIN
jgi:hypothetical protein